jgi:hypothetical protein
MYSYKYSCKSNLIVNHQWMPFIMDDICSFFINIFIYTYGSHTLLFHVWLKFRFVKVQLYMQLWTLAIKVPHKIGTNVVANWVVLDICHTIVTNTWSKWTRFFLMNEKLYFAKGLKILLQQIIFGAT